jgi:hypothetical protein
MSILKVLKDLDIGIWKHPKSGICLQLNSTSRKKLENGQHFEWSDRILIKKCSCVMKNGHDAITESLF